MIKKYIYLYFYKKIIRFVNVKTDPRLRYVLQMTLIYLFVPSCVPIGHFFGGKKTAKW